MKFTEHLRATRRAEKCWLVLGLLIAAAILTTIVVQAQGVSTTTVQGTVYLANGRQGAGTLSVRWPAFTTGTGQAVVAGSLTVKIAGDGFLSVSLAPNQGASPAGQFYTAVYYMSDGSTSTEYWVVPATATATLAQVRAQVMPASQAVQAVSKAYVDQSISQLSQSLLTASGGSVSGPLYLYGDPTQALQAADKHYVDAQVASAVPMAGGNMTGALMLNNDPTQDMQAADKRYVDTAASTAATNAWPGMVLRADQFQGLDFGAKLQACVNAVNSSYGGTCDARNFTGNVLMSSDLTISISNTAVLLPCATITTAKQVVVTAGTRNVALRGCALRGGSMANGGAGGTAFVYSGTSAMIEVGDTAYATDTAGFHMDNAVINTTSSASASAQGIAIYRAQELDLESLYLLGNANQTGMTLDGTGNYTGGTFMDDQISGFQTAVNAVGHKVANGVTTDWMNASTFIRLHVNCPMNGSNPIVGTVGINLQQGDGNTITGGDVEGCATALHLGSNAQNNTIVGLRNENSTKQVVADAGSSYNSWLTGGTMFTGQLTDNGTRNSFLDSFHRSFNALNGDWYGSQQDATLTNHYRLGIGSGNERGLQDRYQTDQGYRWTMGLSDATGGEQYYQILDELNNVNRFSIGQYNQGQSSTNNQTVINSAGSGAVVLNGSSGAGTGGVVIGSGGSNANTVATVNSAGNAQFNGALQVGGTSQSTGTMTVRNNADAEVDYYLWPGLTTSQKGSFTYKDWNGNSQWYLLKDASNNWALNSAVGGLDSFKAYQSTNSGDTYVNASNATGVVRVNYESGAGAGFKIYGGNSSTLYASFTGNSSIAFPGLAAAGGHNCLQIDVSGYITNTGTACGTGNGSGTVNAGNTGQVAYYTGNGAAVSGMSAVPVTAGGTGASSSAAALANLGALSSSGGTLTGAVSGTDATFAGTVASATAFSGPGTGLTGTAANLTAGVAMHAQNLAGDFATQSAATPSTASFSKVTATAISGNVNSVFSVTTYGAVGDCTGNGATIGCTDNATAIQNAIDAAYAVGGSIYFPSSASGVGQTVYYISKAINPKGVSISGPVGSSGNNVNDMKVAVRGAPGKDVFAVGDPASVGYVQPKPEFSVRDLAIIVDDSVDASASFPNRKPGRTAFDGAMTASSAVLTSAKSYFYPGDVGQTIQVNGAGPAGSNLVTTIASYQSISQVTLATTASTTVTNVQVYTSLMGLPVTATVGNCAWAYDAANYAGGYNGAGLSHSDFTNLAVAGTSNNHINTSCGFFFQGGASPYQVRWDHNLVVAAYGFVFVPETGSAVNSFQCAGICDFNVFDHDWILSNYPFIGYGGSDNRLDDVQLYEGQYGVHVLSAPAAQSAPTAWRFNIPETEASHAFCDGGGTSFRITGSSHLVDKLSQPNCTNGATIQWDASFSTITSMQLATIKASNPFRVTGNLNTFTISEFPVGQPTGDAWVVTGYGNKILTGGRDATASYRGKTPFRMQYVTGGPTTSGPIFGPSAAARGSVVFNRAQDFINRSPSVYYFNDEDLWIWPQEALGGGSWNPITVPDATSESGVAMQVTSGASGTLQGSNGTNWYWGYQLPAGKVRLYIKAKADSGAPTWSFNLAGSSSGYHTICSGSPTLTTTYQIFTCDADAGTELGTQAYINLGTPSAGTAMVAWVALRPWEADTTTTSLQLLTTGTAMTANHGNGTGLQHSDGTGASQAAFFDANGNLTATAAALPTGTTATTQSAGDNSTKVATTAYVATPGAITPTTVTASGLVTGANDSMRTTSTTMTNSWTTTGLVLPTVPVSTTKSGHCTIYWQMSSTSYTATFGLGMNNAPTNVWGGTRMIYAAAGTSNWLAFTQSITSTTAISALTTAGATGTAYVAQVDFVLQTGASNPVTMTIYGQTSNSSGTLTVMPGSTCYWLP